jgi:hypothetical protein
VLSGRCGGVHSKHLRLVWWLLWSLFGSSLWKFMVGWLFRLFQGHELQPLEMRLRQGAPFQASFWVAFCGCSLEHTNGGLQCWGSIAGGYRTPTREEETLSRKREMSQRMMQTVVHQSPPLGCPCGSIYRGGQGSHYNAINTLNHLPYQ